MSQVKEFWSTVLDRAEAMGREFASLPGEWMDEPTPMSLCKRLGLDYEELPDWAAEQVCEAFEDGRERVEA